MSCNGGNILEFADALGGCGESIPAFVGKHDRLMVTMQLAVATMSRSYAENADNKSKKLSGE
eukprot:CAMPEP_0168472356 /NCGR_PEP_ID=MMETSP0228-20121227/59757_1 /TAXON_ID=133427 /ORGANISM="Protoceratium reticulatum, Strain CCCM 535 (=CCMP 1889)" /LENGTH=61 /DNA_ID=CAMNT_0008488297 /DNA_START=40 /DNA_END=222 /DNA_ORIENTATION=-